MGILDAPITARRVSQLYGLTTSSPGRIYRDRNYSDAAAQLANGDQVYVVGDASGSGGNAVSFADGFRGVRDIGVNGQPGVRFNGTTSRMTDADTTAGREPGQKALASPATFYWVVQVDASQPNSSAVILNGAGTNAFLVSILTSLGVVFVGGNALSNNSRQFMPSICDGGVHIISVACDTAGASVYVDGYWVSNIDGDILGVPLIGSRTAISNGNANLFAGMIFREIIYQARHSGNEVWAMTSALNAEHNVGLTLYPGTMNGMDAFADSTTPDGSQYRYWIPGKQATQPVLAIFCHPQSGDRNVRPTYWAYVYMRAAMGLGWHVAASDMGFSGSPGGSASSWGNPTAQTALAQLYTAMLPRIKGTPKVVLIGASMGGMASALAVIKGTLPVDAVYFIDAALSMWDMYKTTYSSSIDAGYGIVASTLQGSVSAGVDTISSGVSYAAGTVMAIDPTGTNPELMTVQSVTGSGPYSVKFTAPLAYGHASGAKISDYGTKTAGSDPMVASTAAFAGKPIRYTATAADTAVPISQNTTAFQARLSGVASGNAVVAHLGGHLSGGASNPSDLVRWLKSNGF